MVYKRFFTYWLSLTAAISLGFATSVFANESKIETGTAENSAAHEVSNEHKDAKISTVGSTQGHEGAGEDSEDKMDISAMAMEHISDAYEWHLYTKENGEHVSIPLPVILLADGKLDIFSSAEFHHGHMMGMAEGVDSGMAVQMMDHQLGGSEAHSELGIHLIDRNGRAYFVKENKLYSADMAKLQAGQMVMAVRPTDFSITKNVAAMMISTFLLVAIFISVAGAYKKREGKAPKGFQAVVEPLIVFIKDEVVHPNIGHKYMKYMPYLLTAFFFIFINNLLGLLPTAANVTGNIAVTMTLAVATFLVTNFSGSKDYWKHVFNTPGVPWWLKFLVPIMPIVEIIGLFTKPFALMIRLFANMTAGHIVIMAFIGLIFIFKTLLVAPVSIFFGLFITSLEFLVAFLQAYIFTFLSALFIGQAVATHDDHH